jgi:hypothetical protein
MRKDAATDRSEDVGAIARFVYFWTIVPMCPAAPAPAPILV